MKTFKEFVKEDGMGAGAVTSTGPANVTGPQSSTDPASATAVNIKRKKYNPTMMTIGRKS